MAESVERDAALAAAHFMARRGTVTAMANEKRCETCTEECAKSQMAHEAAVGRMYATKEFILLQKKIESGQLVEVVRCKDCKYWQDNNGGYPHEECRWGHEETPDADDFCSYGERKDGDDDAKAD